MDKKIAVLVVSVLLVFLALNVTFCALYVWGGMNDRKHQLKEREYAMLYREDALEYVKNDSEMLRRYGKDFKVEFSETFSFSSDDGKTAIGHLFQRLSGRFIPQSPEDFARTVKSLAFPFTVGDDAYIVILNKDESGKLIPCEIVEEEIQ